MCLVCTHYVSYCSRAMFPYAYQVSPFEALLTEFVALLVAAETR